MPEKEQIHISVTATTKEEWQRRAAEEGYGTLTNLITTAVEHELDDDYVRQDVLEEYGVGETNEEVLPDIEKEFEVVRQEIRSLREEVMNIAGEEGDLSEEELKELAFEVHDLLPSHSNNEERMTVPELVEKMHSDAEEGAVKEALLFLESNPHVEVESLIDERNNERRWFRA